MRPTAVRTSPASVLGRGHVAALQRASRPRDSMAAARLPFLRAAGVGLLHGPSVRGVAPVRTAAVASDRLPADTPSDSADHSEPTLSLACPICQQTEFPLPSKASSSRPSLRCDRCARTFNATDEFVDLTITSGIEYKSYKKELWRGTTTFQSPLVSFIYERGWRQGFAWAGFPGVGTEYRMAMDYLKPAYGEALVDMSCGSGLFTREFAKCGKFPTVIAADFSENMLRQTKLFVQEDKAIDPSTLRLVRADVGRLPFATGSVSAIHAGAAIHCWPDPQQALAEISRVLKPGGVFVASTFLNFYAPLGQIVGDDVLRPLKQLEPFVGGNAAAYKFWEEDELKDLCLAVGLSDYRREREQRFIMFAVTKPGPQ